MKKFFTSPSGVGTFLTVLYFTSLPFLFHWLGAQLKGEKPMQANEFGDLATGIFGPLAFLWLVIGYWQQRLEIRANGKEIEAQANRIERSIAQQTILAEATQGLAKEAQRHANAAEQAIEFEKAKVISLTMPRIAFKQINQPLFFDDQRDVLHHCYQVFDNPIDTLFIEVSPPDPRITFPSEAGAFEVDQTIDIAVDRGAGTFPPTVVIFTGTGRMGQSFRILHPMNLRA